jgi:hypothetical protein
VPANQSLKLTIASWVRSSLLVVGLCFYYSVFSTYNFDTYQFGCQRELVSLVAIRYLSTPQPQTETIRGKLSAGPLGGLKQRR